MASKLKKNRPNVFIDTALLPRSTLRSSNVQLSPLPGTTARSSAGVGKAFRHTESGSSHSVPGSPPGSPMSSKSYQSLSTWDSPAQTRRPSLQSATTDFAQTPWQTRRPSLKALKTPDSPISTQTSKSSRSRPCSPQSPYSPWEHYRQLSSVEEASEQEAFGARCSLPRRQFKRSHSSPSLLSSTPAEDLPDEMSGLSYVAADRLFNVYACPGPTPYLERKPFHGMLQTMKFAGQVITKHQADSIFDALESNQSGRIYKAGFLRWLFQAQRDNQDDLQQRLMIEFSANESLRNAYRWIKSHLKPHYSSSQVSVRFVDLPGDAVCMGDCIIVAKLGRGVVLWDRRSDIAFEQDPFKDPATLERWFHDMFLEAVANLMAMTAS